MTILHTVNKSPFERNSLESCLNHAEDGAAVLLIEDGVVAAAAGNRMAEKITSAMDRMEIYVLGPDLAARGLAEDNLVDGIKVVDYGGFVELATVHDAVHSWL
jgi:tRNA 2-thiouridine synthesizing protein B